MLKNLTTARSGLNRVLGAILFALIGAVPAAQAKKAAAAAVPYTMYRYETAGSGRCVPSAGDSASAVLKRNGIGYQGKPSSAELGALAKGIAQVERLLGKSLPAKWRTKYNYITVGSGQKTRWNQGAGAINVRRPRGSPKGQNVARLMHELGHKVGNSGEYARYIAYTGGQKCGITGYAKHKNNEQFAEVFSAYVTYPDLLARVCPKSYNFFAKKLFPNSASKVATCHRGGGNGTARTNGGSK